MKRLIALAFLLVLSACAAQPRSVTFDGIVYQIETTGANTETYRGPYGEPVLQVTRGADAATVSVDGQVYRVTGTADRVSVAFPDGRVLTRVTDGSGGSSGMTAPDVQATFEDWDRVDELREIVFDPTASQQRGQWGRKLLLGLVLFAIGLLQTAFPRLAWQLSEGWKYQNAEPSDLYLTLSRIAGVVLMVIGAVVGLG